MKLNSDRNRRIVERMKISLQSYREKNIELPSLIGGLSFSISNMDCIDNGWKNSLLSKVFTLEEIYANAMYENEIRGIENAIFTPNKELLEKINSSVDDISNELSIAIDEFKRNSNNSIKDVAVKLDEEGLMCPNCFDAWRSQSQDGMVICPTCDKSLHNPRFINGGEL